MRVLLDECVYVRLAASLASVEVRTVADQGWLGISNGQLLALAAAEFDVFVNYGDVEFATGSGIHELGRLRKRYEGSRKFAFRQAKYYGPSYTGMKMKIKAFI